MPKNIQKSKPNKNNNLKYVVTFSDTFKYKYITVFTLSKANRNQTVPLPGTFPRKATFSIILLERLIMFPLKKTSDIKTPNNIKKRVGTNSVRMYFSNSVLDVFGECKKPLIIKKSGMWNE